MAAIKLTRTGKAIQFIDDEGRVYQTSKYDYGLLISGVKKFITPVRMPHDIRTDRFPPSPVLIPSGDGWEKRVVEDYKAKPEDAYDLKKFNENKSKKKFVEKTEW